MLEVLCIVQVIYPKTQIRKMMLGISKQQRYWFPNFEGCMIDSMNNKDNNNNKKNKIRGNDKRQRRWRTRMDTTSRTRMIISMYLAPPSPYYYSTRCIDNRKQESSVLSWSNFRMITVLIKIYSPQCKKRNSDEGMILFRHFRWLNKGVILTKNSNFAKGVIWSSQLLLSETLCVYVFMDTYAMVRICCLSIGCVHVLFQMNYYYVVLCRLYYVRVMSIVLCCILFRWSLPVLVLASHIAIPSRLSGYIYTRHRHLHLTSTKQVLNKCQATRIKTW